MHLALNDSGKIIKIPRMKRCCIAVVLVALLSEPAVADYDEGLAAFNAGNYLLALKELNPLAEKGNATAQYFYGFMYSRGLGVDRDYGVAASWYERAAQQGLAKAQNNLGYLYASGLGVKRDMARAAAWYRRAAEQGEAKAQNNLAILYARGDGVNGDIPDPVIAVSWFEKAAAQDLADAQFRLAIVTEQGLGTQADAERALSLLRSAADLGHAGAQNSLGYRYSKGLGAMSLSLLKFVGQASLVDDAMLPS